MTTISLVVLQPLVALIAGILILLIPRLLQAIVGIYLIIVGVLGLWPQCRSCCIEQSRGTDAGRRRSSGGGKDRCVSFQQRCV